MTYESEVLADTPHRAYHLEETSGTSAADYSGNAVSGTYNSVTLNQAAVVGVGIRTVAASSAYLVFGLTMPAGGTNCSIEYWYKWDGTSAAVIWRDNTTSNGWLQLFANSDADITTRIQGTDHTTTGAGTTLKDGAWHHVVLTCALGGTVVFYIDGSQVDTWTRVPTATLSSIRFGRNGALGAYYNAYYDEIAVYNSVLSSTRVLDHFNAGGIVTNYNGTATLAATSTRTAAGVVGRVGAAALAVTATLTATGVVGTAGYASLSATATLTAAGDVLAANESSASLDATATLAATGLVGKSSGAALAATGSLAADAVTGAVGGASLSAAATLTAAGQVDESGSSGAILAAVAELTATGEVVSYDTDTSNADDGIFLGDGLAEIVWEPDVVPPPIAFGPQLERGRIAAQSIDTPPADWGLSTFSKAAGQLVYAPAARPRILIGDVDWTYPNDVPTMLDDVKFIDPLKYGTAQVTIPAINPQYPPAFLGNVVDYFRGKRVTVQLVIDHDDAPAEIVVPDYHKSWVTRVDTDGPSLVLMLGGEAAGRLSALVVPPMVYTRRQTVEHIIVATLHDARVKAVKGDADDTAVVIRRGGTDGLTLVNEHVAIDAATSGDPITYWPDSNGVYRRTVKDTTTIHGTVYLEGGLVNQSLSQDFMEQPNYAYVRGETRTGELIANFKTPGQTQGPAPDFPLSSGVLENGMTNADTTSGAGITALQQQLAIHDFYDYDEGVQGTFEDVLEDGVRNFQRFARLTVTGTVNETTWNRLYNLQKIGFSLDGAQEFPTAADPRLDRFLRTANGSKYAANPEWDPHVQPVGLWIDGGRMTKRASAQLAESKLAPEGGIWTGTLTFKSGFIWGDHTPGDPVTEEMVADRRELLPNMNLKVVWFAGSGAEGIVFHVSGKDDGPEESQALVSTHPAPTMETFAANERLREARSNLGRAWSGHVRASQVRQDNAGSWDTSSGWLAVDIPVTGGEWNEILIPAGQSGIVQRIRTEMQDTREYALILSQGRLGLGRLNTINPLANPGSGSEWYEVTATADLFERRGVLDTWGTYNQPCGYDPGKKSTGASKTGLFVERAGFNYTTNSGHGLYLYVYPEADTTLLSGRILRNQRTTDY